MLLYGSHDCWLPSFLLVIKLQRTYAFLPISHDPTLTVHIMQTADVNNAIYYGEEVCAANGADVSMRNDGSSTTGSSSATASSISSSTSSSYESSSSTSETFFTSANSAAASESASSVSATESVPIAGQTSQVSDIVTPTTLSASR